MLNKLDTSSENFINVKDCQIEATIACYEALQFGYFDDYKMQDWMRNGVGADGTPYHWREEPGC